MDKVFALAPGMLRDLSGVLGAGLLVRGAWLIYRPAGWIVAGVLLLSASFLLARAKAD